MIQEVSDLFQLLQAIHHSVDKMLEPVSMDAWDRKPLDNFNNIASVLEHMTLVEKKFFSTIEGNTLAIDVGAPFRATSWNVQDVHREWQNSLGYAAGVLTTLVSEDLTKPGLKLGIGEFNVRQLIAFGIAHTAHHRGQLPLIIKLLNK